jgi:hypothetical protein
VVLETSLKRMEGHMETKEEVAEQYEKISVFYEQVIDLSYQMLDWHT